MRNVDTPSIADAASAAGLARLETQVAACLGLHFPQGRQRDLLRGAEALARDAGAKDVGAFLRSLADASLSERQMEVLASTLSVGETYFYREPKSLDAFRDRILPDLVRQRAGRDQRLRIWCAGCSTGEEAYTVAMILAEMIPDLDSWNASILATDFNRRALEKARQGVYTEWSFRNMPAAQRERCFRQPGSKTFALRHRFKAHVSFAYLNLATDVYPALLNNTNAMDVIFCRNVLMYLVPELADRVIQRFLNCLVEGGWLIVAPTECALVHARGLTPVPFEGATLYQKAGAKPAAPAAGRPQPPVAAGAKAAPAAPVGRTAPASARGRADPYEKALNDYGKGLYAEAAATLQALFAADASEGRGITAGKAFALMARIDANRGKLEQSARWARKAIAANKVNPGFYYLLATILEEQHQLAEAVQTLKRALYLDAGFILAHFALGHIALLERRRKDADRSFLNAAALLARMPRDEVLAESEGLTAGRLLEIIETMTLEEVPV